MRTSALFLSALAGCATAIRLASAPASASASASASIPGTSVLASQSISAGPAKSSSLAAYVSSIIRNATAVSMVEAFASVELSILASEAATAKGGNKKSILAAETSIEAALSTFESSVSAVEGGSAATSTATGAGGHKSSGKKTTAAATSGSASSGSASAASGSSSAGSSSSSGNNAAATIVPMAAVGAGMAVLGFL